MANLCLRRDCNEHMSQYLRYGGRYLVYCDNNHQNLVELNEFKFLTLDLRHVYISCQYIIII